MSRRAVGDLHPHLLSIIVVVVAIIINVTDVEHHNCNLHYRTINHYHDNMAIPVDASFEA